MMCTRCGSLRLPCQCGVVPYTMPVTFYPSERGWICPLCGVANAPTTSQCFCKNNRPGGE